MFPTPKYTFWGLEKWVWKTIWKPGLCNWDEDLCNWCIRYPQFYDWGENTRFCLVWQFLTKISEKLLLKGEFLYYSFCNFAGCFHCIGYTNCKYVNRCILATLFIRKEKKIKENSFDYIMICFSIWKKEGQLNLLLASKLRAE